MTSVARYIPTAREERPDASDGIDPFLARQIDNFYYRYAECICDDALERWPEFFTEHCLYKVIPRVNVERNLPVSIILSESRGGIVDRLTAIRNTMVYAPRRVMHHVTNIRITAHAGTRLSARSMFSVFQTLPEGDTKLLMVGRSFDEIEQDDAGFRFAERIAVYDTELLPATVIYPV